MNNEANGGSPPGSERGLPGDIVTSLTPREREVLALVAAGLSNRAISERLVISAGTADRHLHNILSKLGCANRTEAAVLAHGGLQTVPAAQPSAPAVFVGRVPETARIRTALAEARGGHGGLLVIAGEPGIGKTRLTEEAAAHARASGFTVLGGRCYEGDWAPPYVAFAEALSALARDADRNELRSDLGFGGPPLARIAPAIRELFPDLPEPAGLGPNEEQFRLLDAVVQLLSATSKRRPLLVVLDDLHWADAATLNMLRYISRFLKGSRICLICTYRDAELDRQHMLGATLAELRREGGYERILLQGLEGADVGEMLTSIAQRDLEEDLVSAIALESGGNPLFIREIILHLIEEGALTTATVADSWSKAGSLAIPESVRQVIGRRLSRLSEDANRLLAFASAFSGPFRFDVAAAAADISEQAALDAIDSATLAQLIHASGAPDSYEVSHALIAHTLYTELNPSRQARVHRRIAEALEARRPASAGEVAYQYHRSAAQPGAEAGVAWALQAADEAAAAYAWEQVISFCEIALELMPAADVRRPEVTGRLGLALPSAQRPEDAIAAMKVWAGTLFERGETEAGLEYLMIGHRRLAGAGFELEGFEVAGFARPWFLGNDNRPSVWFRLLLLRFEEETAPDYVGLNIGSPEKIELFRAWDALPDLADTTIHGLGMRTYVSRAWVLSWPRTYPMWAVWAFSFAGEFRETLPELTSRAEKALREGSFNEAAQLLAYSVSCHVALGNIETARDVLAEAIRIGDRAVRRPYAVQVQAQRRELVWAVDEGWEAISALDDNSVENRLNPVSRWAAAGILASASRTKLGWDLQEGRANFLHW